MKRTWLLIIFLALVSSAGFAQQDPTTTQFMSNPLSFNPSYAGINNNINATLNSRFQWSQFEGSPTTHTLTASSSIVGGKVGVGLMLLSDNIGISNTTEVQGSFAYKISSGSKTFSFGLQTGVVTYKKDLGQLNLKVNDDPLFQPGVETASKFNVGAGATYMGDHFYVSFSVPRLINSKGGNGTEVIEYERHYYLAAAYLLEINSGLKLKPAVLLRGVAGAPISYDLNVSFNILNQFWAGAFTRSFTTYGVVLQFDFMDAYKIGYSFEILGSNFTGSALPTHEIMLSADFAIFSHQGVYKRYF
jgi:type IX secretion system PorP/SprF family membrane protein